MAHGRDKPGKEKRKPKKQKSSAVSPVKDTEVLQHISQQAPPSDTNRT